jgi:Calcineurin-like phosphoesterase
MLHVRKPLISLVVIVNLGASLVGAARAEPVITAAGDIAQDNEPGQGQRATASRITRIDPVAALTLGDNQYPAGALSDFRSSYDPTWGRFKAKTFPTPGNHDYGTSGARGYFRYFRARAHPRHGGYYSFDLGGWHLVAVNTGAAPPSRRQLRWIRRDLRRNDDVCELAYWHHPRWSSGSVHGSDASLSPLWRVLFRAGVDVVLNGHEHHYERFARLTPAGRRSANGIREFVVGTGGASTYPFGDPVRGSQKRITGAYGVLRLALHSSGYAWRFVRVGGSVADSGTGGCHR